MDHGETSVLERKVEALRDLLMDLEEAVICFSGGVDSSYLLAEAVRAQGDGAVALTAVSPSLTSEEGEDARRLADRLGARHLLVETFEVDDPRYAANPVNRCYFCKTEVYGKALEEAQRLGIRWVLDGFNVDDRSDFRPGRKAARELGVRSPLDELEFTKPEIREAARRIDLPVWDKPALACLASRFPYQVQITPERLRQVARCERVLRQLGFRIYRVRYHGEAARIEVASDEISRLADPATWSTIETEFSSLGFDSIVVDPDGYRQGSLNEGFSPQPRAQLPSRTTSRER